MHFCLSVFFLQLHINQMAVIPLFRLETLNGLCPFNLQHVLMIICKPEGAMSCENLGMGKYFYFVVVLKYHFIIIEE